MAIFRRLARARAPDVRPQQLSRVVLAFTGLAFPICGAGVDFGRARPSGTGAVAAAPIFQDLRGWVEVKLGRSSAPESTELPHRAQALEGTLRGVYSFCHWSVVLADKVHADFDADSNGWIRVGSKGGHATAVQCDVPVPPNACAEDIGGSITQSVETGRAPPIIFAAIIFSPEASPVPDQMALYIYVNYVAYTLERCIRQQDGPWDLTVMAQCMLAERRLALRSVVVYRPESVSYGAFAGSGHVVTDSRQVSMTYEGHLMYGPDVGVMLLPPKRM